PAVAPPDAAHPRPGGCVGGDGPGRPPHLTRRAGGGAGRPARAGDRHRRGGRAPLPAAVSRGCPPATRPLLPATASRPALTGHGPARRPWSRSRGQVDLVPGPRRVVVRAKEGDPPFERPPSLA